MSATKTNLERELVMAVREYGISNTLFRNVIAASVGLNVTDMECLGLLFHKGIATPKELANHTGLNSGSTTAMLDRLESAKLIVRRPNPNDRRGLLISVNQEGSKKLAPLFINARQAQDALVASYPEKDLQVLTDFFKRFTQIYEEQRKNLMAKAAPKRR